MSVDPPDLALVPSRAGSERRRRRHIEQFRTDDAEHAALHERAASRRLSFGAYMREIGVGAAGVRSVRRRARLPVIEAVALARNTAALNHIGGNLNQAVRALNELARRDGRLAAAMPLTAPLRAVLGQIEEALAVNRRAAGHDREG